MNRLEHQIHRAVCELLIGGAVPNCFWFHLTSGGRGRPSEAKIVELLGIGGGVPKLILIHKGQTYGLELKAKGGQLSPEQKACHVLMREAGASVETAYGLEQAIEHLAAWGLLRTNVKVGNERSDIMASGINSLELSWRSEDALRKANIITIGQVMARTERGCSQYRMLGAARYFISRKNFLSLGLRWRRTSPSGPLTMHCAPVRPKS